MDDRMVLEGEDVLAGDCAPYAHDGVIAASCNLGPIRRKDRTPNLAFRAGQGQQFPAAGGVPKFGGAVATAREEPSAVGGKGDRSNSCLMSFQSEQFPAAVRFPELRHMGGATRAGQDAAAIWRKSGGPELIARQFESEELAPSGCIPYPGGTILAGRNNVLAVRGECHGQYPRAMPAERERVAILGRFPEFGRLIRTAA